MVDNVKILEDLVVEAVDRLQDLSRDRDRLGKEVGELRESLDVLNHEASRSDRSSDTERGRQEQARAILQEALVELHGD
jgi:hypothetical protein